MNLPREADFTIRRRNYADNETVAVYFNHHCATGRTRDEAIANWYAHYNKSEPPRKHWARYAANGDIT